MGPKEKRREGVDWIQVAQDSTQWWVLSKTVIHIQHP
jgi:hypothetical protein